MTAEVKIRMGVHSMNRGMIERPCFDRASYTCLTHAGRWPIMKAPNTNGIHMSAMLVDGPAKEAREGKALTMGVW